MQAIKNQSFSALLRHETRWVRKNGRPRLSRQWWMIYAIFFLAAALILTTYFSLSYHIEMNYIWSVCWGIPWVVFGFSIAKIRREWGNGTVGWWLALPYSRWKLIAAKFLAMLVRGAAIALLAFVLIILFGAYATLISSSLSFHDFQVFILSGWLPILLDLASLPLLTGLGLLLGILRQSTWRPASILFWVFWGILWSLFSSTGWFQNVYNGRYDPLALFAAVIISGIAALLMLLLSSWLLDKKLDL